MKTRLLLFCCLLNAPMLFGVSHTQLCEELDSSFSTKSFDLIQLTDEEIMYDAYQVKTEVAERTLIGEVKLTFTEENILLQFELPDYFVSTSFDFIVPDKEIR